MTHHNGFLPIMSDANGVVGVKVEHPYTVDVRGVGAELTKHPRVQIIWFFDEGDGQKSTTLPDMDYEAVAMLKDAVAWAERYLTTGGTDPAGPGITFSRAQIEAWVGHSLTDDEVAELEEALPNSSLPDCVDAVAHEALKIPYPDAEDPGDNYTGPTFRETED